MHPLSRSLYALSAAAKADCSPTPEKLKKLATTLAISGTRCGRSYRARTILLSSPTALENVSRQPGRATIRTHCRTVCIGFVPGARVVRVLSTKFAIVSLHPKFQHTNAMCHSHHSVHERSAFVLADCAVCTPCGLFAIPAAKGTPRHLSYRSSA